MGAAAARPQKTAEVKAVLVYMLDVMGEVGMESEFEPDGRRGYM